MCHWARQLGLLTIIWVNKIVSFITLLNNLAACWWFDSVYGCNIFSGIPALSQDCSEDESYGYDFPTESGMFLDGTYQVIKWTAHQPTKWVTLLDEAGNDLWVHLSEFQSFLNQNDLWIDLYLIHCPDMRGFLDWIHSINRFDKT